MPTIQTQGRRTRGAVPSPSWIFPFGLRVLLSALVLVFFALHFVHITADFPNNSPWMDWSKYTDEGWYGAAAIRHFELGHWYVPGDFNPAAALPVWPLLEAVVFRFTGVSLTAARALTVSVFGAILLASWLLLRGPRTSGRSSLTAMVGVVLLVVSPFCFVFTRLAILEPLLVLLTLLALLTASRFGSVPFAEPTTGPPVLQLLRRNGGPIVVLGLLLPAMVLTKTTGVFLFPAVLWMLWATMKYRFRSFLIVLTPVTVVGLGIWLVYYLDVVRPHYLLDYRYLFSANGYTGITRENFFGVLFWTLHGGFWMGRLVYWVALAAGVFALLRWRLLRRSPVIPALVLWAIGYAAFLAYHNNLQPRYYFVIAVPLTLLIPVAFKQLVLEPIRNPRTVNFALTAATLVLLVLVFNQARQTLAFVLHPQYTFIEAARRIHSFISADQRKDPAHSSLVLSISGSDLSLMTGLHSICDDFGTLELGDRVQEYRPGWYVAWNDVEDDKMDALTPLYRLTRVASFPAMDDRDRNLLILYRLDPPIPIRPHPHHRKPVPRSLQTKVGQQPSATQLVH